MTRAALLLSLALPAAAWAQQQEQRTPPATFDVPEELSLPYQLLTPPPPSVDAPATGSARQPPIDPTKNVLDLVAAETRRVNEALAGAARLQAAEVRRIDDLREAEVRRLDELREAEEARTAERTAAAVLRSNDLRDQGEALNEARFAAVQAQSDIRDNYTQQLRTIEQLIRETEADRINKIREVDAAAAAAGIQAATTQAGVIAAQVQQTAANLADQLAGVVSAQAESQSRLESSLRVSLTEISDRLSSVEQGQFQAQGRSLVADPALTALVEQVRVLASAQESSAGRDTGVSSTWGALGIILGAILGIAGLVLAVVRRPSP